MDGNERLRLAGKAFNEERMSLSYVRRDTLSDSSLIDVLISINFFLSLLSSLLDE